ncbi:uncharacterized protein LOC118734703 [Rhagoletis pomonella]|uniref:uncharacterized protein LOC118734703 n=1 Tax=Rhagoletis pomonella TaxID=28610 RepID=UPI001786848D|nr:uncharacterized protein LOC118734703 [Rhagoletis pomonella]
MAHGNLVEVCNFDIICSESEIKSRNLGLFHYNIKKECCDNKYVVKMSELRRYLFRISVNSQRALRNRLRSKRKLLRESTDPFCISEERFTEIFRLPKEICRNVFNEIRPFMLQRTSSCGLSKVLRFLVALRFFAQGSYQRSVGQDFLLNVSQSSVSRCIREIASIMDKYLLTRYIKFPSTVEEKQAEKKNFIKSSDSLGS